MLRASRSNSTRTLTAIIRLVVIDTYLAYVNEVVTEKTDSKNHITRDAYMSLDVYKTSSDPVTLYDQGQ